MNELANTKPNEVAVTMQHVVCGGCFRTGGFEGTREAFLQLLEAQGWRIGTPLLCPDCVSQRGNKMLRKLRAKEEEKEDRW